jgi:hypothetical protein
MRKLFSIFALALLMSAASSTQALQLDSARITRVIRDVKLLPSQAAARPATESDNVKKGTAVRTGTESRAELTFTDETITRLGANTIFSFNEGTREVELGRGAILVQVPPNGKEAKISTAAVTAGITGGTALFESNKNAPTKFLVMEGRGSFYPKGRPGEAVIVHAGEMVMMTLDGRITKPEKFNAKLVFETAKLLTDFDPLPNQDLILAVIEQQQADMSGAPSNPPDSNNPVDVVDLAVNASLSPLGILGAKFGPPSVITTPNPYVIKGGTQINTDPTITTGGVTNSGKIYRGVPQDGNFLTWLGATPTAFDNASGEPHPGQALPLACFLFSGLQFDGDPVSTTTSGNPTVGLGSEGGITFTPGTAFTFSGFNNVGILALNGSIDTTGVSFANFGHLFMEARGSGSNLTFGSPVSNMTTLDLVAETNVAVNAAVTLSDSFQSFAGNDFQTGSVVKANHIDVKTLGSIIITNTGQLLGLLNSTGGSGQVLLAASGSDTIVRVDGAVQADQGEIDIRQTGVAGFTILNNATLHGDIIKISALGNSGTLTIGAGNSLTADTILKLYAGGSNGTINFNSNVTLNSPTNILAANTINIAAGVVVFVNSPVGAQVFTTNANYFNYGGSGTAATSGTFGGAGAQNPQALINRPPLGAPGGGP